ncbi:MAG: glycosyltransferase [Alteromonas sp.]|nr:MAG: glycosyltransferase [Alteromonas sp.]
MVNILHVTYDMRIGGTEMVIKNIVEGCDDTQYRMSIYCIESPLGPWGEDMKKAGLKIVNAKRKAGFDLSLIKSLRQYIIKHKIDIVHCHQYTPWVYGAFGAAFTKARVLFTEHGRFYPDSTSWKRKIINPILTLLSSNITAISKATKQALTDFEYIPEKKIQVIYNGIAPVNETEKLRNELRQSLSIDEGTILLGTVARFDPIKNHTMMIEAFDLVKQKFKNVKLVIIGDGEERANIESLIDTLSLNNDVILTGYKQDAARYIQAMDLFLLSSLSEGTSMTLLESLSLGVPCIVTDAGGNAEIIKHKEVGLVTLNNDKKSFSEAILVILSSPSMYQLMKNNCRPYFNENFHANRMNNQYSLAYDKLKNHG